MAKSKLRKGKKAVVQAPVVLPPPERKLKRCRDCGEMFEPPKGPGRPPVRCPGCKLIFDAQKDPKVTTSERIALKRSRAADVPLESNGHSPTITATVVEEVVETNAEANHQAARKEAKALRKLFMSFGWVVKGTRNDETLRMTLTATRGEETVHFEWQYGRIVNVLGGGTPKAEAPRTMGSLNFRDLPFDPRTDDDVVVMRAVMNHKITWENRINGFQDSDIVRTSMRNPVSLTSNNHGDRILNFLGENGFRSVSLGSIRKVH